MKNRSTNLALIPYRNLHKWWELNHVETMKVIADRQEKQLHKKTCDLVEWELTPSLIINEILIYMCEFKNWPEERKKNI